MFDFKKKKEKKNVKGKRFYGYGIIVKIQKKTEI